MFYVLCFSDQPTILALAIRFQFLALEFRILIYVFLLGLERFIKHYGEKLVFMCWHSVPGIKVGALKFNHQNRQKAYSRIHRT